jgi:glucan-binding YG repeat protein
VLTNQYEKTICKVLATAVVLQAAMSLTPSFAAAEQQGVTQQSINSAKQTGEWEKWWNWYYKKSDGSYHKGWLEYGNKLYYLDSYGAMQTGTVSIKGTTYNFDSNGALTPTENGMWINVDNTHRYYLNNKGVMQTGLVHIGNSKVYFKDDGTAHTGYAQVDGKKHYFKKGYMVIGWFKDDGKWYYQFSNGTILSGITIAKERTGWVPAGEGSSYSCYLNSDGTLQTGQQTIDGKTYNFDSNGVLQPS